MIFFGLIFEILLSMLMIQNRKKQFGTAKKQ